MLSKLSAAIKGLPSLGRPFSKATRTLRTDSSLSSHRTLKSSMDNHNTQPIRYLSGESKPAFGSGKILPDIQKNKRMSQLKDDRILK